MHRAPMPAIATAGITCALSPGIHIVVRSHSDEEAIRPQEENVREVFPGERELAVNLARHVLQKTEKTTGAAVQ